MADDLAAIQIPIELAEIRNDLGKVGSSVKEFTGETTKEMGKASHSVVGLNNNLIALTRLGGKLFGFGLAIGSIGVGMAAARRAGAEFERQLSDISTLIDVSDARLESLGDQLLRVAAEFDANQIDVVRAQYQALSAGINDVDEGLGFLNAAAAAARAGQASLSDSVRVTAAIINAYGLDVSEAEDVTDSLFVTVREGVTTFGELANAIGPILPLAAELDVSIGEVNAAIGALTRAGFETNKAVTGIGAVFQKTLKPSEQAKQIARELGIEFSRQAVEAQGLLPFLQGIREATGDNTEAFARLLEEESALRVGLALTGTAAEEFARQLGLQEVRANSTGLALDQKLRNPVLALSDAANVASVAFTQFGRNLQRTIGSVVIYARDNEKLGRAFEQLGVSAGLLQEGGFATLEALLKSGIDTLADYAETVGDIGDSMAAAVGHFALFQAQLRGVDSSRVDKAARSLDLFHRGLIGAGDVVAAVARDLSGATLDLTGLSVTDAEAKEIRESFEELESEIRKGLADVVGTAQAGEFEFDFADDLARSFEEQFRRGSEEAIRLAGAQVSRNVVTIRDTFFGLKDAFTGVPITGLKNLIAKAIETAAGDGIAEGLDGVGLSGGEVAIIENIAADIRKQAPELRRAFTAALKAAASGTGQETEAAFQELGDKLRKAIGEDIALNFDQFGVDAINAALLESNGLLVETRRGFELLVGVTRDSTGRVRAEFDAVTDSLRLTKAQLDDFRAATAGFDVRIAFKSAATRRDLRSLLDRLSDTEALSVGVELADEAPVALRRLSETVSGLVFKTRLELDDDPARKALARFRDRLTDLGGEDIAAIQEEFDRFLRLADSSATFSVNVPGAKQAIADLREIRNQLDLVSDSGTFQFAGGTESVLEEALVPNGLKEAVLGRIVPVLGAVSQAIDGALDSSPVIALREEFGALAEEAEALAASGLPIEVQEVGFERLLERLDDLEGRTRKVAVQVQAEAPSAVLNQIADAAEDARNGIQRFFDASPLTIQTQVLPPDVQAARRLVSEAVAGGADLGGELSPQLEEAVKLLGAFADAQARVREIQGQVRSESLAGAEAVEAAARADRDALLAEVDALEAQGVSVGKLRQEIEGLTAARIADGRAADDKESVEAAVEATRRRVEVEAEVVRLTGELVGGVAREVAEIEAARIAREGQIQADIALARLRGESVDALEEELRLTGLIAERSKERVGRGAEVRASDELAQAIARVSSSLDAELIQIEQNERAALSSLAARRDLTDETRRSLEGLIATASELQRVDAFARVFQSSARARGELDTLRQAFADVADELEEMQRRGEDVTPMLDQIGRAALSSGEALRRGLANGARDALNEITNLQRIGGDFSFTALTGSAEALAQTIASIGDKSKSTSEVAREAFRSLLNDLSLQAARAAVGGLFQASGIGKALGVSQPQQSPAQALGQAAEQQRLAAVELLRAGQLLQQFGGRRVGGGGGGDGIPPLLRRPDDGDPATAGPILQDAAQGLIGAAVSLDDAGTAIPNVLGNAASNALSSFGAGLQTALTSALSAFVPGLFGSTSGGFFASLFAGGGNVPGGGLSNAVPIRGYAGGGPLFRGPHIGIVGEGRYDEAVIPTPNGVVEARVSRSGGGDEMTILVAPEFTINALDTSSGADVIEERSAQIVSIIVRGLEGESDRLRTAVSETARG